MLYTGCQKDLGIAYSAFIITDSITLRILLTYQQLTKYLK